MLYYPQVYKGKINGGINSNKKNKTLKFDLDLKNGHFIENQLTVLISNTLKIDITKENFSQASIKGTKFKDTIKANLNMQSNNMKLTSKTLTINNTNNSIYSIIYIELGKYKFDVKIEGSLNNPKVTSDIVKNVIKQKTKNKIEEVIEKKLGNEVKGLFQNFLNFK